MLYAYSVPQTDGMRNESPCVMPLKHRVSMNILVLWKTDFGLVVMKCKDMAVKLFLKLKVA
jgi:hypothetical protein